MCLCRPGFPRLTRSTLIVATISNLNLGRAATCMVYDAAQLESDACVIQAHSLALPQLPLPLTSVTAVIDAASSTLYAIGRTEHGTPNILELPLSATNRDELRWTRHSVILQSRVFGVALEVRI